MTRSVTAIKTALLLLALSFFLFSCGRHHGGGGSQTPLSPPTGLAATPLDGQVALSWNPTAGATSYSVYMDSVAGVTKTKHQTVQTTGGASFTQNGLTNGVTYYFVVTAGEGSGESAESAEVSATPSLVATVPPSAPAGLRATAANGQVTLDWGSVQGATSYYVYIAEAPAINKNNWTTITGGKRAQDFTTIYINTSLSNGTTYYFVVTAVNAAGESGESSQVSATPFFATTIPALPGHPVASPGDRKITLTWDAAADAASYRIYWVERVPSPSSPPPPCPSPPGHPVATTLSQNRIDNVLSPYVHNSLSSQIQTGLRNGNTYYYIVTAVNDHGESQGSSEVCAVPTPTPPPTAVTLEASDITIQTGPPITGSATLNGKINPNGFPITEAYFEWGVTTAYGQKIPIPTIGSGTDLVSLNVKIGSLNPSQIYHYRIVAKNANQPIGISEGADASFTLPFLGAPHEYSIGLGGTSPNDLVVADFDGDGRLDIATANDGSDDVSILIQAADGTFGPAVRYHVGKFPQHLAVVNFLTKGPDLIVSNNNDGSVSHLANKNDGSGAFTVGTAIPLSGDPRHTSPVGVAVGDFNKDGISDVAVSVTVSGDGKVAILLGDGLGGFFAPNLYPAGESPSGIVAEDFNGDGNLDLVVTNSITNQISLLLGFGDGTFPQHAPVSFQTATQNDQPNGLVTADFDHDGFPDLAVANKGSATISIFFNNHTGGFDAPISFATGLQPIGIATGDFDHNGAPDVVVPNFRANIATIYLNVLNAGVSAFDTSSVSVVGEAPVAAAVGDFNNDGKLDLAVANISGNSVSVLFGQ